MSKFNLLEGDVDTELFQQLIDIYNEHQEEYVIFFSSRGGRDDIGELMIDLINMHSHCTTLIGSGYLYSKGFDVFFKSECHRVLKPITVGLVHGGSIYGNFNHVGITDRISKSHYDQMIESEPESREFYKGLGLTKKELKLYDSGDDVILSYKRLNELLNNQKAKNKK